MIRTLPSNCGFCIAFFQSNSELQISFKNLFSPTNPFRQHNIRHGASTKALNGEQGPASFVPFLVRREAVGARLLSSQATLTTSKVIESLTMRAGTRQQAMQANRSGTTDPYRDDVIPADLYDTSSSRFSDAELFRRSPDGRARAGFPWRTTFVALFLFSFGIGFLLTGVLHFWDRDRDTSIAFIIVGSIAFLPGAYVGFNLIQVLRGAQGFHLSQFAHWDDFRS